MSLVIGNDFNNALSGTILNDTIRGEGGNDTIVGGRGNDDMFGGLGNDLFFWNEGDGSDLMAGGGGVDTVNVSGASIAGENFFLSKSNDTFLTRTDTAPIPRVNNITLQMSEIEILFVSGVEGNDRLVIGNIDNSGLQEVHFNGGSGNDLLDARNSSVRIGNFTTGVGDGGSGNDTLLGGKGFDHLVGGSGNDTVSGNDGVDIIYGTSNAGGSNIPGRGEKDLLTGGAGGDFFVLGDRKGVNNSARVFYDDGDNNFDFDADFFFSNKDGTGDFARITDFKIGEDRIRLVGRSSDYVLHTVNGPLSGGSSAQDMGIFKAGGFFRPQELIAVVQDVGTGLNLNDARQFQYV
ncbi:MAG: hypothetical protein Kow00121_46080 [Elainellaceae cyanobacterium]